MTAVVRRIASSLVLLFAVSVDDVHSARFEESQRLVEMTELPGPGIGVDEIELPARRPRNEFCAVDEVERDACVRSEMTLGDGDHVRVGVDRIETCGVVHPRQQPRTPMPGAGPQFEEPPAGFGCRERGKERSYFRLRDHREAGRLGVTHDGGESVGCACEFGIIHQRNGIRIG